MQGPPVRSTSVRRGAFRENSESYDHSRYPDPQSPLQSRHHHHSVQTDPRQHLNASAQPLPLVGPGINNMQHIMCPGWPVDIEEYAKGSALISHQALRW